jgi:leucyl-tRNA synthetase
MKYHHEKIEAKWQQYWAENQTFAASNSSDKPKYYVLDMFPYPSGAGLHVGHPLGYIASDIVARYKRHQGFNVLHPQGYDSFGLPAEQYAIQTGQHPADTTRMNIEGGVDKSGNTIQGYRNQLDRIGFSFDWSREVRTSNPDYYKHTQWIFIQLYNSWYNKNSDKAEDVSTLVAIFATEGNTKVNAVCDDNIVPFSATEWNALSSSAQQKILLHYRLTYLAETEVNWCSALGTVLANDEIVNGVSERGGHPVVRKKMTQWSMRISAYAERLLQGLNDIDWSESIKESQRNWIGKSVGAMVSFNILTPALSKGEGADSEVENSENSLKKDAGYLTGDAQNASILLEHAKEMRKEPTSEEAKLWDELRNRKLEDKFRRQHLVGNYIVDFVCLEKKLIIEVDGGYHFTNEQIELDSQRTLELEQKHFFKVIRFTNEEVNFEITKVLTKIKQELENRKSHNENLTQSNSTSAPSPLERVGVRKIEVFTTRPDTIFGVTFMTLAPEHELVSQITTPEQKAAVEAYVEATAKRSERERMADVKTISGVFTGAYAEHPFTKEPIPVWIGDYVLAGYGTGAVMAVPCGDERDYAFAKHFDLPIINILEGVDISEAAHADKNTTILTHSEFLNGLSYKEATKKIIAELEKLGAGNAKVNYRLRDAVFSRQRYWGEPFPVYYVNGLPQMIDKKHLPIVLPEVEKYLPTEDGQPPLGNAPVWAWDSIQCSVVSNQLIDDVTIFPLELNTMPGWAGSSWYWMRYMDAHNTEDFANEEALKYWESVDLYIGGSEHATGHLLYSRFWNKFLKDRGYAPTEEPFKKLINQGMILGMSAFVYRSEDSKTIYSKGLIKDKNVHPIHVDLAVINDITNELDIEKFKAHPLYSDYANAEFVLEDGKYIVGREVEKMSKSKYNVVSPDDICEEYGADTLRLYEMFLGPLEQSKPWNTAGITGVSGFLKKLWRLYFDDNGSVIKDDEPTAEMYKSLHKTIKKVTEDIENFSFNTSVSQFMICVNELQQLKCNHRAILEPLALLVSPYAPHIAEELWSGLGHTDSIATVAFPKFEEKYLVESEKEYPVSFNGKMRFTIKLPLDLTAAQIEEIVMADERTQAQLQGRTPNKVIIVPGKIINLVG